MVLAPGARLQEAREPLMAAVHVRPGSRRNAGRPATPAPGMGKACTTSSNALPTSATSHLHAEGVEMKRRMMQVPTTASRTMANAEAQPRASSPKQLAEECVLIAKQPSSFVAVWCCSSHTAASAATASRWVGFVSQHRASS